MSGIVVTYGRAEIGQLARMHVALKHRGQTKVINLDKANANGHYQVVLDGQVNWMDGQNCGIPINENQLYQYYKAYGLDILQQLNGAFAFAIAAEHKLLVARDPFGLKPLYYGMKNGTMFFASEIKALVGITKQIRPVPPGHYYHSDHGWVQYFTGITHQDRQWHLSEALAKLRELLTQAIATRARSKPVGIFLSGGIDSSVIAAAASNVQPGLKTFAVGSANSADLPRAREVAQHLGAEHYELIYRPEQILHILPAVIYHLESFDQYLVRSSVVNYLLAQMAAEHGVPQILCGEGGDELFAGYHYLKDFGSIKEIAEELETLTLQGHANGFQRVDRMTSAFHLEGSLPFMDRAVSEFAFSVPVEWKLKNGKLEKWILRKAFEHQLPDNIVWREKMKFFEGAGSEHIMERFANELVSDEDFARERELAPGYVLRSKEELWYYWIFREFFPERSILDTVGRTRTISS